MRAIFTPKFLENLESLPFVVQKKFRKQLKFLMTDLRHPSLMVKKYGGAENVWQARVDKGVRFYFTLEKDAYVLLDIRKHD